MREFDKDLRDWFWDIQFKGKSRITFLLNRAVSSRAIREGGFDVLHPTYYDPYFLKKVGSKPFVITVHDMTHELYPEGLSDASFRPAQKRKVLEAANAIVAVTENTKKDIVRLLGVQPGKISVVHHGNELRPDRITAKAFDGSFPYWLYVGSRHAYKNWAALAEKVAARLHKHPDEHWIMLGGGRETAGETRLLRMLGIHEKCHFVAASERELAGYYASALALLYPSKYEGFGMPILEAMAWSCPVLAANSSCLPEVGGDAALYFETDDLSGIEEHMDAVQNPAFRAGLVGKGLIRESAFRWEQSAREHAEIYSQIARK